MENDAIDMITRIIETDGQFIQIELRAGGDLRGNLYEMETYPCLADYWKGRLQKKECTP